MEKQSSYPPYPAAGQGGAVPYPAGAVPYPAGAAPYPSYPSGAASPPPYGQPTQVLVPMPGPPMGHGPIAAFSGAQLATPPSQPMVYVSGGVSGQPLVPATMMRAVDPIPDCPAGLESLALARQISVRQTIDMVELFTNIEMSNSYTITDENNSRIYFALEQSNFCARQCLGTLRPMNISITDNLGRQILTISRPFRCDSVCCPFILPINYCWLQRMDIFLTATGSKLGSIEQKYSIFIPKLFILDELGNHAFTITGPCWHYCRCDDINFELTNTQGQSVGRVVKKWSGFCQEAFTNADNFSLEFLPNTRPSHRALLLAAAILIDFMYFEHKNNDNNNNNSVRF